MGTKGTWRRPAAVSDAELAKRWDEVFKWQPTLPDLGGIVFPPAQIDEPPTNR